MVTNAKKAGFNPLTVLRNGGAAGFQITNTPFLTSNPRFVDWQNRVNNQNIYQDRLYNNNNQYSRDKYNYDLSVFSNNEQYKTATRSHWANAFTSIAGAALKFNPLGQKQAAYRRTLENQLLVSEIGRNDRSYRKAYSLQPSQAAAPSSEWLPGKTLPGQVSYQDELALRLNPKAGKVTVTNPWTTGEVDPGYLDAEIFEQRYGDIAQEFAGVRNLGADTWFNWSDNFARLGVPITASARVKHWAVARSKLARQLNFQKSNYWELQRAK